MNSHFTVNTDPVPYLTLPSVFSVPNLVALKAKMATTIIPIIFAQYYIWPLAQFISFKYCPAPLRVLYTNAIAVFWNCFMCSRLAA